MLSKSGAGKEFHDPDEYLDAGDVLKELGDSLSSLSEKDEYSKSESSDSFIDRR